MSVAVVTGATAGIGAAFARALATQGYDLVLVARDGTRLSDQAAQLAAAHGVTVTPLPADLATAAGRATVEAQLDDVDLLVNSAGIGLRSSLLRSTADDLDRLVELNVVAVQRLTRAALPGMVERRRGAVVNVSSVAGFAPQKGTTYAASKAWVTNFSESAGLVVRRHGVRVMALCPGYTRTEFHARAGIDAGRIPAWLWLSPDEVVRAGLRDLRRGRLVSVPDWRYKLASFGLRHTPHRILNR